MKHPSSLALYGYWNELRAGRAAPERGELDPGAIRAILGDVMILEVGGPDLYTVRLAGTRICSLLGRELKERSFLDSFAAASWPEVYALLDTVVRKASPAVASIVGETEDKRMLGLELLLLPLRHHGRTDKRLLVALAAYTRPFWAAYMPLTALRIGSARFDMTGDDASETAAFGGKRAPLPLRVLQGGRA